ncbi:MAG: FAD-dependent oxidoreductase [Syntrophorhabdales bacterium]|jgi:succinate dehydrogenase/fumarate reductase flavoprotein subunit
MSEFMEVGAIKWPYPVRYGVQNVVSTDVLVLGGGSAGMQAAINAARKGVRVAIVEKADVSSSGSGGVGCDHWQHACTNPACQVSPEEFTNAIDEVYYGYFSAISRYITCTESYDTLLDMEKLGVKIRDTEDEFKGAQFRDEETKLLFAYDYQAKYTIRWWGTMEKAALTKECRRLGVEIYNRKAVTSLLTTRNRVGGTRATGAVALDTRTGDFYVFGAKAIISCLGIPMRLWNFSTEVKGFAGSGMSDPNCAGEGYDICFRAGAAFGMMEKTAPAFGPYSYPPYGTGNTGNTWRPCTIVDAEGKEIPWVDKNGKVLKTLGERNLPSEGQKFFIDGGGVIEAATFARIDSPSRRKYAGPELTPDLVEHIRSGEFRLPLYADLPSMPEHERRAIFGLMVAQEGKTKIPIYFNYTRAGFDPDKDMLECPVLPEPDHYRGMTYWFGTPASVLRDVGFCVGGGAVIDWDLRTNIEGLYVAGSQMLGGSEHSIASVSGRYAGRTAAEYARQTESGAVDEKQVAAEKARIYAPTTRKGGIHWKELNAGLAKVMQEYCGSGTKSEKTLKEGLKWMKDLRVRASSMAFARNPHELMRVMECFSLMSVGEMTLHGSLARRASSLPLAFRRIDYPELDPPGWNKFTAIRWVGGEVEYGEMPLNYAVSPPFASSYEENYRRHCFL